MTTRRAPSADKTNPTARANRSRTTFPVVPTASDPVAHPAHYTSSQARCECGEPIECIQITEWMPFTVGNVIKYLWRAGLKEGSADLEDLRKAQWYLAREVSRRERLANEAD